MFIANILTKAKTTFGNELKRAPESNIIEKLYRQDINYLALSDEDLETLIEGEKEILESDTKKVGLGIAIGVGITLLTKIIKEVTAYILPDDLVSQMWKLFRICAMAWWH